MLHVSRQLLTDVQFERGTVSYMITATVTRPTPINPTTSCERKVELVEQVDVGSLVPPRPRTIYLEPISKRAKKKKPSGSVVSDRHNSASVDNAGETTSDLDSTRVIETSTDGSNAAEEGSQDAQQNPRSPVQSDLRSEVSGDSAVSGSTGRSNRGVDLAGSLGTIQTGASMKSPPGQKTIVTTIELMKGGCLPGDTIPVRVNIQHTKPIRSMYGVIVTLYRQGRVDSAPPASLFKNLSKEERRRLEKDEYYPRSKTGLGGLSLTSAGSCSVFRKDLSQAFSPLIVDPVTFTASVTTTVRVPEDAFPSIRGVPGEMISFKYRLEVIVDLGGKLSNAIQIGQQSRVAAGGGVLSTTRDLTAGVTSFDGSLINTDALKREKGVIYDSLELVVGTTDSSRIRGKTVETAPAGYTNYYDGTTYNGDGRWPAGWEDEGYGEDPYLHDYSSFPTEPASQPGMQYPYWNGGSHDRSHSPAPHYIPPPTLPDENGLSEKQRIRRAEQRLLPSQPDAPPQAAGPSHLPDPDGAGPSTLAAPTAPPPRPPPQQPTDEPSAPSLDDLAAGPSAPGANHPRPAIDDKQELERQRLLGEVSAPPEFPEDYDAGAGAGASNSAGPSAPPPAAVVGGGAGGAEDHGAAPSAPILTEEDEYGPQFAYNDAAGSSRPPAAAGASAAAAATPSEPLPAYQR